jgi:hypothetical protein
MMAKVKRLAGWASYLAGYALVAVPWAVGMFEISRWLR